MKKTIPTLLCFSLLAGSVWAVDQKFLEPIMPVSPVLNPAYSQRAPKSRPSPKPVETVVWLRLVVSKSLTLGFI